MFIQIRDQLLKLASIGLCANTSGQVCMALVMNPPRPGDPSFELFSKARRWPPCSGSMPATSWLPVQGQAFASLCRPRLPYENKDCFLLISQNI